ncbi:MAG TPA: nitroreductase family protein [Bacteriovoracaceae bacterium]|nr:nitroreductase family protein [Bacteriovoracaceae bacterium]
MDLDTAIFKRRSVRKFTEEYVSDSDIKQLIDAARWAPSWANTQSWDFIVLRDSQLMAQITELYSERNPARSCSLSCNAMLVVCARMKNAGHKMGVGLTKFKEWFMFDIGCCVQNISLKAYELGLGSVIVGHLDHEKANRLLNLPANYEVVVTIPLGHPVEKDKAPPPRREIGEMLYLNQFGEKFIKE